jgi:translation initiation factor eIF-2B subunit gamma
MADWLPDWMAGWQVSTLGEAAHLTGYCLSQYDNVVDASAQLGQRATVGPACIVGERVVIGDKSSIKRSVIGPNTRLGNNVKVNVQSYNQSLP